VVDQKLPEQEPPKVDLEAQAWAGQELTIGKALTVTRPSAKETVTLNAGHLVYVIRVADGVVTMDTGQYGRFQASVADFRAALSA
jgi:hypothetical protein